MHAHGKNTQQAERLHTVYAADDTRLPQEVTPKPLVLSHYSDWAALGGARHQAGPDTPGSQAETCTTHPHLLTL